MTQARAPSVTEERIYKALRQIIDPELGINIVDLGLVYDVQIQEGDVVICMTLTTRGCPLHGSFVQAVERAIRELAGVTSAHAQVVWEPRWNPDMISPEGKQALAGTGRRVTNRRSSDLDLNIC